MLNLALAEKRRCCGGYLHPATKGVSIAGITNSANPVELKFLPAPAFV